MIEIRGQRSTDWQDVYEMRIATSGALPYIRPDWVRDELAKPGEGAWPMVAAVPSPDGLKVVARVDIQLGWGRRAHCAYLTIEQHPEYVDLPGRELLREAVKVVTDWWNKRRVQVKVPTTDPDLIALLKQFDFVQEARLQQGVRIAGELVDEIVLACVTGDAALPQKQPTMPPPTLAHSAAKPPLLVTVRGGSSDDWEAYHAIWSQPSVIWGTMQIPYPSADWNRERVQYRQPSRFWPLVAEAEGEIVGNLGFRRDEHNRGHVGHIGMMVHHDYQGRGVGSALMEATIDLAENWLGLTRMQLEVYPDNAPAIRLYDKFGFEYEGRHRAFGFRDGHFVDTFVMGRLRDA